MDHLSTAIIDGLDVRCGNTIDELFTFVVGEDGTCGPEGSNLADRVMALGVAVQAFLEDEWKDRVEGPPPPERKSAEWYHKFKRINEPQKRKIGMNIHGR